MGLIPPPFLFTGGSDRAEQPIGLVIRTGCKIERVGIRVSAAAQGQCPQPVDGDRLSLTVPESSAKVAIGVECIYLPITKITHEDVAAEAAKSEGRARDTPWRIKRSAARKALQQIAIGVIDVDEAVSWASHIIVLCRVLERISQASLLCRNFLGWRSYLRYALYD